MPDDLIDVRIDRLLIRMARLEEQQREILNDLETLAEDRPKLTMVAPAREDGDDA